MIETITEIEIIPIKPQRGLVAFAQCVLNNSFYLSSIGIHKCLNKEGYRLTYPTKRVGDKQVNLFHPINKPTSQAIEKAIINKYLSVVKTSN